MLVNFHNTVLNHLQGSFLKNCKFEHPFCVGPLGVSQLEAPWQSKSRGDQSVICPWIRKQIMKQKSKGGTHSRTFCLRHLVLHNGQWTLQKHLNKLLNCPTAVFIRHSLAHTPTVRHTSMPASNPAIPHFNYLSITQSGFLPLSLWLRHLSPRRDCARQRGTMDVLNQPGFNAPLHRECR